MKRNNKLPLIATLVIVVVMMVYLIFIRPNYYWFNGGKILFEPVKASRVNGGQESDTYAYGGYLYISSSDGLKKIDYDGNSIWDKVFSVKNPKLLTNDRFMTVIDSLGHYTIVFNEDGMLYDIEFDETILGANISDTGATAYILEDNERHIIRLYDSKGTLISERVTYFKQDGFPVELELSGSGETMITSYLKTEALQVNSELSVFNFSSKGLEVADKIIAGKTYENSFVTEIEFFDDEHFVVLGDNILEFYELKNELKLLKSIPAGNIIDKIAINNEMIMVLYGKETQAETKIKENTIVIYGIKGNVEKDFQLENGANNIIAGDKCFYVVQDEYLSCYNSHKKIWQTEMHKEIDHIIEINSKEYLLINQYGYEIIRVKGI